MLDAFMNIAEPFFQPHDGLSVGREAKVSGLDDARMDGPNCDLVHRRAFRWMECVGIAAGRLRFPVPERVA